MNKTEYLIIGAALAGLGLAAIPYFYSWNLILCAAGGHFLGKAYFDE